MAVKRFRTKNKKQRKQRSLRKQRSQRKVSRRNTKGGRKLTRKKSKRRNVRKGKKSTRKKSQRGGKERGREREYGEEEEEGGNNDNGNGNGKRAKRQGVPTCQVPARDPPFEWTPMTNRLKTLREDLVKFYHDHKEGSEKFTHVCFMILFILVLYNGGKGGVNINLIEANFNSVVNQAGVITYPIIQNIKIIIDQFYNLSNNIGVGINWFINYSGQFTQVAVEEGINVISEPFINALKVFWNTNPTLFITIGTFNSPNVIKGLIKYAPKLIIAVNNSRTKLTEQLNETGISIINKLDETISGINANLIPAAKWFGIALFNAASTPLITPLLYTLKIVDTINNCFHTQIEELLKKKDPSLKPLRDSVELVGELNPPGSAHERRDSVESVQSIFLTNSEGMNVVGMNTSNAPNPNAALKPNAAAPAAAPLSLFPALTPTPLSHRNE